MLRRWALLQGCSWTQASCPSCPHLEKGRTPRDAPILTGPYRRAEERGLQAVSMMGSTAQIWGSESRVPCAFDLCRRRSVPPWASCRSSCKCRCLQQVANPIPISALFLRNLEKSLGLGFPFFQMGMMRMLMLTDTQETLGALWPQQL